MNPLACNFDPNTTCDDGSCIPAGCIDPLACNFNPLAGCDNGTCGYFSADEIISSSGLCPDRLPNGVGKAKIEKILDRFLAEVVVDAKEIGFVEAGLKVIDQLAGGG